MKSTSERVEVLKIAGCSAHIPQKDRLLLLDMASECEQELPKPLVFEMAHGFKAGNSFTDQFTIKFNRYLTKEDFDSVMEVLFKAFPA